MASEGLGREGNGQFGHERENQSCTPETRLDSGVAGVALFRLLNVPE